VKQSLECAGRAKRRRRFGFGQNKSGVALRLPPHSKKELLIWFGDWNYKHFAPLERYNPNRSRSKLSSSDTTIVLFSGFSPDPMRVSAARAYARVACLRETIARPTFIQQR
jgi:hypothetical protein